MTNTQNEAYSKPVTRLVPVDLGPPGKLLPPRDQINRNLPRTNGIGVALAYGANATVYRNECPMGPNAPQRIRAGDGAVPTNS